MDDFAKCYRILEIEPGSSQEDISQAYKDLVFIWHPDRIPKDNHRLQEKAQAKLKELNHARDTLRKRHAKTSKISKPSNTASTRVDQTTGQRVTPPRRRTSWKQYSRSRSTETTASSNATNAQTANSTTSRSAKSSTSKANATQEPEAPTRASSNGSSARRQKYTYKAPPRPGFNNYYYTPPSTPSPTPASSPKTYSQNTDTQSPSSKERSSQPPSNPVNPSQRKSYTPSDSPSSSSTTNNGYYSYDSADTISNGQPSSIHRSTDPDLSNVDWRGRNLSEKDFSGRNLSGANLSSTDLSDTFLHNINLNRANLHRANLFRANLLRANLSHANLREANLIGADLSGANLTGADLSGAKIGFPNKIMVKMTGTILRGTIMPDGTIHE